MAKYGDAAVFATKIVQGAIAASPVGGWELAVAEIFPDLIPSQKKGCPRGAYLGLCEEGPVKGVAPGRYTKSKRNKEYALRALALLSSDPALSGDRDALWQRVMDGKATRANGQIDVIMALWHKDLLNKV